MANAKNEYQGDDLKVLCVCSAGLLRSPTVARVLHRNYENINARAVGHSEEYALIPLEPVHVHWADVILCADEDAFYVASNLQSEMGLQAKLCVNLQIPDQYNFGDPKLEKIIQSKLDEIEVFKECSRI